MTILKKRLALALTVALFTMLNGAPLALAETSTSVESIEAIPSTETLEATEISSDPEGLTNTEATEQTEGNNELENTTGNDDSESPDIPENTEGDILDENGEVVPPGTLPDSPFYWLTTLIEKLQVALTFDPVEKTELLEEQGLERIAEAAALIEQGDIEQAEATLNAFAIKAAEAQEFLAQLAETDSETRLKLETALGKTHANNVITLGGLLEKLPPQAAQRVALNIVRSMEKSITKMDKQDLRMVAQELKKVTKGLEDNELAEEDEVALENLDQALAEDELEEDIAINSGTTLINTALETKSLTNAIAETSKPSSKSSVQNVKSNVAKPILDAKVELESTTLQEQKQEPKVENQKNAQQVQDESELQEQKPQESKIKEEQESTSQVKNPSLSNDTQKQDVEKPQSQNERGKGTQSGGKGKEK
ncbi:DUF5667 domain-containing protein [Desulfosporosinus fructosivorans]